MCGIYFCPSCDAIVEVVGEPAHDFECADCGDTLQPVDVDLAAVSAQAGVALAMREG